MLAHIKTHLVGNVLENLHRLLVLGRHIKEKVLGETFGLVQASILQSAVHTDPALFHPLRSTSCGIKSILAPNRRIIQRLSVLARTLLRLCVAI